MEQWPPPGDAQARRARSRGVAPRLALAALLLLCAAGVVGIAALELSGPAPEREAVLAPPPAPAPAPPPPSPPAPAASPHAAPSFDVVRVSPSGDAVVAGRAEPGDQVTLRDGAQVLGRVTAGPGGEWVLTAPLPPGGRELTLSARDPARPAAPEVLGAAPVLVVVPDHPGAGGQAQTSLAVLTPPGAAPRVLQGAGTSPMGLDAVDYDEGGRIRFSGHAPPGAAVRLYVDNAPAGDARADAAGRWTLTPERSPAPGTHRLRVDQLGERRVVARVELPFRRALLPAGAVPAGRVVVQPGENLWRIARAAYGEGTQYTVIYRANRDQIRDPAVIYPGQTFDVPKERQETASPPARK